MVGPVLLSCVRLHADCVSEGFGSDDVGQTHERQLAERTSVGDNGSLYQDGSNQDACFCYV